MAHACRNVLFLGLVLLSQTAGASSACCDYGTSFNSSGLSCREILLRSPSCRGSSGLYWVENSTSSYPQQVHCDMDTLGGGWERVVDFHASHLSPTCPSSLLPQLHNGTYLCHNNGGIIEMRYTIVGESFSEVRGSVVVYASGDLFAFSPGFSSQQSRDINGHFVDGVAVLLDDQTAHLKHIHSFGIGNYEHTDDVILQHATCPGYGSPAPSPVVGSHYTCALLRVENLFSGSHPLPVWDLNVDYCESVQRLCTQPSVWFYHQVARDYPSNSTELVVKVMSQSPGVILLRDLTVYVR